MCQTCRQAERETHGFSSPVSAGVGVVEGPPHPGIRIGVFEPSASPRGARRVVIPQAQRDEWRAMLARGEHYPHITELLLDALDWVAEEAAQFDIPAPSAARARMRGILVSIG